MVPPISGFNRSNLYQCPFRCFSSHSGVYVAALIVFLIVLSLIRFSEDHSSYRLCQKHIRLRHLFGPFPLFIYFLLY